MMECIPPWMFFGAFAFGVIVGTVIGIYLEDWYQERYERKQKMAREAQSWNPYPLSSPPQESPENPSERTEGPAHPIPQETPSSLESGEARGSSPPVPRTSNHLLDQTSVDLWFSLISGPREG